MELNEDSIRSLVEQVVTNLKKDEDKEELFRYSGFLKIWMRLSGPPGMHSWN